MSTSNDLSLNSLFKINLTSTHLITNSTISTRTHLFTQDTTATKYQIADYLIRLLELTKFTTSYFYFESVVYLYISRGRSTVLLLVNLHQLKELQRSNEHKGVSDKFMSGSVPCDSNTYYIVCT